MEAYEHRVINGLLKAGAAKNPGHASNILAQDVEIVVAPDRSTEDDLWPAIWALAAGLARQISGYLSMPVSTALCDSLPDWVRGVVSSLVRVRERRSLSIWGSRRPKIRRR